jgi:hypothetical protein
VGGSREDEATNFITISPRFSWSDSKKGIVLGSRLDEAHRHRGGTAESISARRHLELRNVHRDWRDDTRFLGELERPLG